MADKKLAQTNPKEKKLIQSHLSIVADQEQDNIVTDYTNVISCQVGLPRSKTEALSFERRNGTTSILIEAGKLYDGNEYIQQPLPYGAKPRLIFSHIDSFALKNNTRHVDVGNSVTEYVETLGLSKGGTTIKSFKQQMNALSVCRMQLGFRRGGIVRNIDAKPIKQFDAWLGAGDHQPALWSSEIILDYDYFEILKEFGVPQNRAAIAALKDSALALDIYRWLSYRLCQIKRPSNISWKALRAQFGQEYNCSKNFKNAFKTQMRNVLSQYPAAKVELIDFSKEKMGGIKLKPSNPPVPKILVPLS